MPKPSRKTIEPLLEEWATLKARAVKIEKSRDLEVQPIKERFERQCASINSTALQKLAPIHEKLNVLTAGITKQMLAGVGDDGTIALPQVSTETAIAECKNEPGNREINPEKFFDLIPQPKRDSRFWKCVKILVGPSEKLFGDLVNTISKKPTTPKVEIKLK